MVKRRSNGAYSFCDPEKTLLQAFCFSLHYEQTCVLFHQHPGRSNSKAIKNQIIVGSAVSFSMRIFERTGKATAGGFVLDRLQKVFIKLL